MLALAVSAAALGAVGVTQAIAAYPNDFAIAKDKSGPYKSKGADADPPADNPQKQTQKVKPHRSATFFVRMQNSHDTMLGTHFTGDPTTAAFKVTYLMDGVDITSQVTGGNCLFIEVPAHGKVLVTMKIKATGAGPGDSDYFGAAATGSLCDNPNDIVYAKVKVT
jgi:hypothetical protein